MVSNQNRFAFDWLTTVFRAVDSLRNPHQNLTKHQDTGIARTNLLPRARWLARADVALRQPSGNEPSHLARVFFAEKLLLNSKLLFFKSGNRLVFRLRWHGHLLNQRAELHKNCVNRKINELKK
jgi:hypothetical protein